MDIIIGNAITVMYMFYLARPNSIRIGLAIKLGQIESDTSILTRKTLHAEMSL